MDIYCTKCNKLWHENELNNQSLITPEQKTLFLQGQGCPSCGFDQKPRKRKSFHVSYQEIAKNSNLTLDPSKILKKWRKKNETKE